MYGHGAHSSEPESGVNAIVIASQIVNSLMSVLGTSISPYDIATFSICKIKGGDAINVIPDYVEMSGMIRCVEKKNKMIIRDKMRSISEHTAASVGGRAEVDFIDGFPSVNNDSRLTGIVIDSARTALPSADGVIMTLDLPSLSANIPPPKDAIGLTY